MYVYMFRKSPSILQKSNPNSHLFYCLSSTYHILVTNLSAFCSTLHCSQQNEDFSTIYSVLAPCYMYVCNSDISPRRLEC